MSFSKRIFIGLFLGLITGIFFGELVSPLKLVADGFVKLLQMTVLPYMIVSIISSLGSLNIQEAKTLGLRAGLVLISLWAIGLIFCFLFPLVFPQRETASFFSTSLIEKPASFDLVGLYIPANPFHSLANSIVPAVVLFSVLTGVALIGVERKQLLLDVLKTVSETVSRVTRFVVSLTPYGIFAIAASVSGTIGLEQVGRIEMYLLIYIATSLLIALWVLPGLVSSLTSIRTGEILGATRDSLIVAFMAGDLLIVLPVLTEVSEKLLKKHDPEDSQFSSLPEIIIPSSFNFPHIGKLLSLSFVLFAGWFTDAPVSLAQYPKLALTGLVTFFGSLNAAIPFLLDLFRIPADSYQLFLATSVINSRFGTLLAVMHTVTVALLGSSAVAGRIRWRSSRIIRYVVVTVLLTVAIFGGARFLFQRFMSTPYDQDQVLMNMRKLLPRAEATVFKTVPPRSGLPFLPTGILDRIRQEKVIRVCFDPGRVPYSFFNRKNELVGFDIGMAHQLGRELGVRVEFIPMEVMTQLDEYLAEGNCDIAMSGIAVTTRRASRISFSMPYLDETTAFLVPDYLRNKFGTWEEVRRKGSIAIGVPNLPYYLDKVGEQLPEARIIPYNDLDQLFSKKSPGFEIAMIGAERGSALSLLHPEYSVVVPGPDTIKIPLAYALAGKDDPWVNFVNIWIELKRKDRTIDVLYNYWILGQNAAPHHPRWSVIRDVLHWVR